MNKLSRIAAVSLVAVLASTALAQAGGYLINPTIKMPTTPDNHLQLSNSFGSSKVVDLAKALILNLPPKTVKTPYVPINIYIPAIKPSQPTQSTAGTGDAGRPQLAVACIVRSPAGVTDDMLIVNTGTGQLPAGTQIDFKVRSSGDHGAFLLARALDAGSQIRIPHLLHSAETGAPCDVKLAA